ncbi:MAG: hypothetical protein HY730_08555 [Candidatus Tectomicrobia bacterium]|uniref:Uncharacterized protein n=1 Tax=Tectimicrobiota bacterium TaxID=2528274 RepID=A0A933GNK9_UNCTE|nr:hypothetical protein [Candidatus Tectomicrobia bacterium]
MLNEIKAELTRHIDAKIVDEILVHHNALKIAVRMQDWEKCLLRGGKFGEAVMRAIHFIRTGQVTQQVHVESEISEVGKRSDLPESIRLLIPRAVRLLYDLRSKRGGAHGSFDPNAMDCAVVVAIADWTIGELVRVYCTADPERAMKFVAGITAKSIPIVERIEEDYVVLSKGASARQEIGFLLYSRYPERTTTAQLRKWTPNHSAANLSSSLANMRKAKLVHCNSDGALLTTAGIRAIEKEMLLE